jgi:hypothetical protein
VAELVLTLENQIRVIKAVADLATGWQRGEKGFMFSGAGQMDFHGDRRLRVQVQVRPNAKARSLAVFPQNLEGGHGNDLLSYRLSGTRLEVFANLEENLKDPHGNLVILRESKKPGFYWQAADPIKEGSACFYVSLLVVFTLPSPPTAKVTWEHDLLPFLSGGQFESNRRGH